MAITGHRKPRIQRHKNTSGITGTPGRLYVLDSNLVANIVESAKPALGKAHVISRNNKWILKKDGGSRAIGIYTTQRKAIDVAKEFIQEGKITTAIVHSKDGTTFKILE